MKKVLAILVSFLFSFSVVAFAQETPTKTAPTPAEGAKVEKKAEPVKTTKAKKKTKKKKVKKSKKAKKTEKTEQESPQ